MFAGKRSNLRSPVAGPILPGGHPPEFAGRHRVGLLAEKPAATQARAPRDSAGLQVWQPTGNKLRSLFANSV